MNKSRAKKARIPRMAGNASETLINRLAGDVLMNWWAWPHKNDILTNTVHIFENILPPYITIRPDDHVLGWKEIMALHL